MVFVNQTMRSTYALIMRCKAHESARNKMIEILDGASKQIDVLFQDLQLDGQNSSNNVVHEENDQLDEMHIRDPVRAKSRGITISHITRHWDDKSKKRKGKGKGKTIKTSKLLLYLSAFMLFYALFSKYIFFSCFYVRKCRYPMHQEKRTKLPRSSQSPATALS